MLTSGITTVGYDDISNRTTAEGKTYTANELNQYTAIDSFTPQYDADGNQTLIKTSTGIWSVTYNAENRPVRWESGDTVVTMDFDRMGRRTFYKEEVNGEVIAHHKFVHDNYLCAQKLDALNSNSQINLFVCDPNTTTTPSASSITVSESEPSTATTATIIPLTADGVGRIWLGYKYYFLLKMMY